MIRFFVPGIPAPGGSKRVFINRKTGRPIVTDDAGKRNKDWRTAVGFMAAERFDKPAVGALCVEFHFTMPRPKNHFGTGKNAGKLKPSAPEYHSTRPDTSKLIRAAEDALTGIAWLDDAQIAHQVGDKAYGDRPGVWIAVEAL